MIKSQPSKADKVNTEFTSSAKIIHARTALGLTQKEFAELLGIDRSYLSQLEKGKRPVRAWIVDKCVALLMEKGPTMGLDVPSVLKGVGLLTGRAVSTIGPRTLLHAADSPNAVLTKATSILASAPTEDLVLSFEILVSAKAKASASIEPLLGALVSLLRTELSNRLGIEFQG